MADIPHWGNWQGFQDQSEQAAASSDPIGLLLADHEWMRSVISEAGEGLGPRVSTSSAERKQQVTIMWGFIDAHIHKEEDAVFPALDEVFAANGRTDIQTEDMYGEHDAIRIRYAELQEVLEAGTDPAVAFRNLWKALAVHFDNEEEYIFDEARNLIPPDLGHTLAQRLTSEEFASS